MRLLFLTNRANALRARISNTFTLPERFKGTVVEKWAKYWTGLVRDYKDVGVDVVKFGYNKPRKALVITGASLGLYACVKRNPDEEVFLQLLRQWNNKLILVSPTEQNVIAKEYVRDLELVLNRNTLRTLSLGFCTLLWVDLYSKDDCTYKAICEYTGVDYLKFYQYIIDIGFWNRYWRLDWKMRNFDINYL
ncbi:mitochondrial import inner membrane translocase subunit Tim29 [Teleopsis dalmanni]|uniref:mitochondrial import inner membrane translocase subunit Tim29 n=1 Tax=Teleopsis dalmanni TaxID=139649 RepID=UPI0018CE06BB|nr:mitochondrial import inner membrane translocase subunit Tim29 [Teleopsis dalmanni]